MIEKRNELRKLDLQNFIFMRSKISTLSHKYKTKTWKQGITLWYNVRKDNKKFNVIAKGKEQEIKSKEIDKYIETLGFDLE